MGIPTNELIKGDMVELRNGWNARIEDNNKRGATRMATVFGLHTEMGSVYSHDIVKVERNGVLVAIDHTPKQIESARMNSMLWGGRE